MDSQQVFKEEAVMQEFLDRFDELREHAPAAPGGLEGFDGGADAFTKEAARDVAESMAEGVFEPGTDPGLEAIIERFTRPVYLVQDSTFVVPPDTFPDSAVIAEQLKGPRATLE